ncbi:MAG: PAS domain S-box protein, partial [Methanosarcinaceae archaeon]|nr:PAS domain S-box protein [Methanosarcinaceae archaeon]
MMNIITVFDLMNLLVSLTALIILFILWKRALVGEIKYVLFGLLVLIIFRSLSNVLEWSGITTALDPFEDFVELLEPLWWGFFLYAFLQESAKINLQESKNKYKTLFENLPQKIFNKDVNSVYVSCNENYAKDLNIGPDEIVGKTDYDLYSHELADKYRADDKRIIESGLTEEIEEEYIIDGNKFWVNSVKTSIKNEDGKIIGIQGIFWDITERKEVENAFYKSYEMFSTIMDSLDAIVYIADMKTYEILFVNKYTHDIFGDVLGKICWKTFPVDQSDLCDFCTNDKLVDANGEPVGVCSWEHYNENVKHWYSIRDRAIRWIDGRIVRLEIAFDITKQKEHELERTRLSRIIESSLNEIYVFDAKTLKFIHVNEGALNNLGYTQEEMHSMTPLDIKPDL